jgi:hypothetical protein
MYFMGGQHTVQGGVTNGAGTPLFILLLRPSLTEQNKALRWTSRLPSRSIAVSLEAAFNSHVHLLTRIGIPLVSSSLMPMRPYCTLLVAFRKVERTQMLYRCIIQRLKVEHCHSTRRTSQLGRS